MKKHELFPGSYLKAVDVATPMLLTIANVTREQMDEGMKPVVHFSNEERDFVLNKTNYNSIAEFLGEETDEWGGRQIVLFRARVDFQGKQVDAIRVRQPKTQQAAQSRPRPTQQAAPQPAPQAEDPANDDDVPF